MASRNTDTRSNSGFGPRNYRTSGVVRELILATAGAVAWWFTGAYYRPLLRDAHGRPCAGGVPHGIGFGYASDTLPKRLARFGRARATPTTGLVLMFFLFAVLTVTLILAYLAVDEGEPLCLEFSCNVGVSIAGEPWRPFVLPHAVLGKLATAGVGLLLAGSVMLIHFLLRPREHDYLLRFDLRRIGARAFDVMILLAITIGRACYLQSVGEHPVRGRPIRTRHVQHTTQRIPPSPLTGL